MIDRDIEKARETDLVALLDSLDIPYDNASDHVKIICPFHEEVEPSCALYEDGHYYCYGCGENGNAIDFVMKTLKVDFNKAVNILLKI